MHIRMQITAEQLNLSPYIHRNKPLTDDYKYILRKSWVLLLVGLDLNTAYILMLFVFMTLLFSFPHKDQIEQIARSKS